VSTPTQDADVIVVGAGPAGSTTAYHLAQSGADVLVLEKSSFPREKVCGDGLTPRAVKAITSMGIDTSEKAGWLHNRGLRIIGGGMRLELPWPDLATFPTMASSGRGRTSTTCWCARRSRRARCCARTPTSGPP
jgi:menaquinone-9 beta-reductase